MADNDNTRGEWVVGMNPDDRMPNDWLRMVARVFTAYRENPLKESIVAYIDGLNVTLDSHINQNAIFNITPGQSFVDDQFIGFLEDSKYEVDTSWLRENFEYCLVLEYQWINQMPAQQPRFNLVQKINVHPQQMLCLATITIINGEIFILDDKKPWWMFLSVDTGNTEVDGPELLPYIVSVKGASDGEYPDDPVHPENEQGSLDVGWAVDFHHYVGNHVNYNARLHTDRINDGSLYINNNQIISEGDLTSGHPLIIYFLGRLNSAPTQRLDTGPLQDGDVYYDLSQHMYFYFRVNVWVPLGSGSGSGEEECLVSYEYTASVGDTTFVCAHNPNQIQVIVAGITLPSTGYIADGTSVILSTPAQANENIRILSTALGEEGDCLTSCEFTATEDQDTFICDHDHSRVQVIVSGLTLPSSEYNANGTTIVLGVPARAGDSVIIISPADECGCSGNLPIEHNFESVINQSDFVISGVAYDYVEVYTDGIRNRSNEFTWTSGTDTTITFNEPRDEDAWILIKGQN